MAIARRFSIRKFAKWLLLSRVCRINLKTLLGKTFRPFVNQQVPGMGVIRGKIQVVKPYTPTPNPQPLTPHTLSPRKTFSAAPK
jgi:hypothetical protein